VNLVKFRREFPIAQQAQPFRDAPAIGGQNLERLPREREERRLRQTLRPLPIPFESV
jgi:hypothetical protein